jgi:hypothetical protein
LADRAAVTEVDELLSADDNVKELPWRRCRQADFYGRAYGPITWV